MDSEPKENSDLLAVYKKDGTNVAITRNELNGKSKEDDVGGPPDGGFRAHIVMIASFLTNGLLFGVINSYGGILIEHEKLLKADGVSNANARASFVGALAMGTTFFLSPLSGILTGLLGLRLTAVLGGSLAFVGLLLSSFVINHVEALYFTYGILYGLGASLAYTPSLAILGHYFKKHLGLVNGIVCIGSSVFSSFMPTIISYMINNHGLAWMFRVLAGFTFGIALCGFLFKPIPLMNLEKPFREDSSFKSLIKTIVNIEIWRNKKYRMWALSMPVALFGYFIPYIHLSQYIKQEFKEISPTLPIQGMAVTSGIGRLAFGFLADKPGVDRILLQQISFYIIGTLTIILPFVNSFPLLMAITLGMGIVDGGFIALIGPIAIELCGGACAAQAIGCMLGMAAAPLSFGPPFAGYLIDLKKSYVLPFVLAGISPIVGATLMFTIRYASVPSRSNTNGYIAPTENGTADIEKSSTNADDS